MPSTLCPFCRRDQVVHGDEALVRHHRVDIAHAAPNARRLQERRVFLALARPQRIADGVVGVAERDELLMMPASGFDPCTPERKEMVWKKVCEAVLKAVIVDLVERIGHAHTLEGMPLQRVAEGEIQAVRTHVVVLRQRLLGCRQVQRCAGGGLVVLGRVVILLVVEDLESHVDGPVADIRLREAEEELAADAAQVAPGGSAFRPVPGSCWSE